MNADSKDCAVRTAANQLPCVLHFLALSQFPCPFHRHMPNLDKPPLQASQAGEFNPYLANPSDAQSDAKVGRELASLGQRFFASCLDTLFFFVLAAMFGLIFFFNANFFSKPFAQEMMKTAGVFFGLLIVIIIQLVLIKASAQSLGKRLVGIQVWCCDTDRPCNFSKFVFLRYCLPQVLTSLPIIGIVFFLVDIGFIFAADRRCLHDKIANTIVVKV